MQTCTYMEGGREGEREGEGEKEERYLTGCGQEPCSVEIAASDDICLVLRDDLLLKLSLYEDLPRKRSAGEAGSK